jgi:hypothetical protein
MSGISMLCLFALVGWLVEIWHTRSIEAELTRARRQLSEASTVNMSLLLMLAGKGADIKVTPYSG